MNFENPKIESPKEKNILENKKSAEFRAWITEQALAPSDKWDSDFRDYVNEKYRDNDKEDRREAREVAAERYLKGLDLNIEDLKGKSVLDLGCETGDFVRYCLDNNITKEAYGLDSQLKGEALNENYKDNFFESDFKRDLPVKNLDYILSVGAVSLYADEENLTVLETTINKSLDALSKGGQIRIYPIPKVGESSSLEGVKETEKAILSVLRELEQSKGIQYEMRPIDIHVSGAKKDVWLEQVLIIKQEERIENRISCTQEEKLARIREDIENWADMNGKGIDESIKETVIMLSALDMPTSQSCEGHIESGTSAPWVGISAPNVYGFDRTGNN
ncbi:class I SAM-dependent methyltransferase [Patescibacteria group bacterium]|nr:class I SAM-dependent methyltransferase [Patescibacteria group bacterium]